MNTAAPQNEWRLVVQPCDDESLNFTLFLCFPANGKTNGWRRKKNKKERNGTKKKKKDKTNSDFVLLQL